MINRLFLMVVDSFGIGGAVDAKDFGDEGSNTLLSIQNQTTFKVPNLKRLGLMNINGVSGGVEKPLGAYARLAEKSLGKDTIVGHWELAGIVSTTPFKTYENGFPQEVISEFEKLIGTKTLCNKPYSGTEVIKDYGKLHIETGYPIIYTSQDSVFQIATHDSVVSVEKLYSYCEVARKLLVGKNSVARVIARPFTGDYPYVRTGYRKDYAVKPPKKTMLNDFLSNGYSVISVGKINDIFCGEGISESYKTKNNQEGYEIVKKLTDKAFKGLCFINFVDFDSVYGHRNDAKGYAKELSRFDRFLGDFILKMQDSDALIITADHGCDPLTPSTDHSRENVPFILYYNGIEPKNLGTVTGFDSVSETALALFNINKGEYGKNLLKD
ncbi:MAG: phosphopentomutase [Clostridia bacterium]|nr:phosphopentomutase [Clostridia bacterium]